MYIYILCTHIYYIILYIYIYIYKHKHSGASWVVDEEARICWFTKKRSIWIFLYLFVCLDSVISTVVGYINSWRGSKTSSSLSASSSSRCLLAASRLHNWGSGLFIYLFICLFSLLIYLFICLFSLFICSYVCLVCVFV